MIIVIELDLAVVKGYKDEVVDASAVDTRLVEIDSEIKALKASLSIDNRKSQEEAGKREKLPIDQ